MFRSFLWLLLFVLYTFFFIIMSAVTLSSLSLAFQEIVVPWLVAHHVFDVTVNQSSFGDNLMVLELSME